MRDQWTEKMPLPRLESAPTSVKLDGRRLPRSGHGTSSAGESAWKALRVTRQILERTGHPPKTRETSEILALWQTRGVCSQSILAKWCCGGLSNMPQTCLDTNGLRNWALQDACTGSRRRSATEIAALLGCWPLVLTSGGRVPTCSRWVMRCCLRPLGTARKERRQGYKSRTGAAAALVFQANPGVPRLSFSEPIFCFRKTEIFQFF